MNTRVGWVSLAAGLLVSVTAALMFAEDKDAKENQPPPKPPELKVLDRLVGTWNSETINKVAEWTPKELRTTGTLTREWVLGGRFLQEKGSGSDGLAVIAMFTYDVQKKAYRVWHFNADGSAFDGTYQWDEASQTFSSRSEAGDGKTSTVTLHIIENDAHEWKVTIQDKDGKVYLDLGGKCTRKK